MRAKAWTRDAWWVEAELASRTEDTFLFPDVDVDAITTGLALKGARSTSRWCQKGEFSKITVCSQCLRLKSSMPFKCDLALQNIPLSKQPFKTQPQIENDDVAWSPQYDMPTTRTNKRRALSLQEMELEGWFLILHIVLETCTIQFMHKFNMSFVFRF